VEVLGLQWRLRSLNKQGTVQRLDFDYLVALSVRLIGTTRLCGTIQVIQMIVGVTGRASLNAVCP